MTGRAAFFRVGSLTLALDSQYVRQVVSVSRITRVPRSSSALIGLFADHGNIFPLMDIASLLGLAGTSQMTDLALLVEHQGAEFALRIDEIIGFSLYEAKVSGSERFSSYIIQRQGQDIPLLDLHQMANYLMTSLALS